MLKPVSIISQTLSSPNRSPPGPESIPSISFKIRRSTVSSAAESLASKRQWVIAAERSCIAKDSLGDSLPIKLYAKNLVIATRASEVIGAEVDEERMTCKKGCSSDGISKLLISVNILSR